MAESAIDLLKKYADILEGKQGPGTVKITDAEKKELEANKVKEAKEKKDKKPVNTKESAGEFFRKYSDIISEAEECKEEDDTEESSDKDDEEENLPPWLKKKDSK